MLTETKVRNCKSRERPYKLFDERGMFLLVSPSGSRLWRFRYKQGAAEKLISLGAYPDITLRRARDLRDEARRLVANGVDPSVDRRTRRADLATTFQGVAKEWLELQAKSLAPGTMSMLHSRLNSYLFPYIGSRPVAALTAQELLSALRRIEAHGKGETAHRARAVAGRVLRYAVATGRAMHDVAADLREALAPVRGKNFASVKDPIQLAQLLRAIDGYSGHTITAMALKLAPLVFVRPGELRGAEWIEIDLPAAEWRIPAARMKMRQQHIVPLSRQSLEILEHLRALSRGGCFVFPSLRSYDRPMSNNTINAALRRLGYTREEQTGHGFRSTASTLLNEMGFPPDVIELQLAHAERNKVRAAYNKAQRLIERRSMMQQWADFLDELKASNVPDRVCWKPRFDSRPHALKPVGAISAIPPLTRVSLPALPKSDSTGVLRKLTGATSVTSAVRSQSASATKFRQKL